MPKANPFPCKFTVQLSHKRNDMIYMLAAQQGITPGEWARQALRKASDEQLQGNKASESLEASNGKD